MTAITDRLRDLARPTGEEDLLNVAYPKPRVVISPRAALIGGAVLFVLVFAVLGRTLLVDAGPTPTRSTSVAQMVATSPSAGTSTPPATSTSAAPSSAVVSVVGAVASPGLVTLEPSARIADALVLARPHPDADLMQINQAERVTDGTQIIVPTSGQAVPAPVMGTGNGSAAGPVQGSALGKTSDKTSGGKLSLNSATASELEQLPGVGAKTAAAIIAHRDSIGGFSDVAQLKDIKGIGPAKFAEISPLVTV